MFWLFSYITEVISITGLQLLLILGPFMIIGLLMHFLSGVIERKLCRILGLKLYLCLFGWVGTCVHESGHALFCVVFRHKINEIKFLQPDLESGSLGYVRHSYNPKSFYQSIGNFFIGIGPIILGAILIYFSTYLVLDDLTYSENLTTDPTFSNSLHQGIAIFKKLFRISNFTDWKFYLFIYISLTVGSSVNLSLPDLKGSVQGLILIIALLLSVNLSTLWIGNIVEQIYNACSYYFLVLYTIMIFSILIHAAIALMIPPSMKSSILKTLYYSRE